MRQSPANQTVVASSVFLDLVGFSRHSTTVQVYAKGRFNAVLRGCLDALGEPHYWVRDLGDGALVICPGSPEHALFLALHVHRAFARWEAGADAPPDTPELQLRIGLNLGALRTNPDLEGRANFLGDGINATQRVMDFAQPGQILASRSFVDAIAFLHSDYTTLFNSPQTRQDKHGRSHEVYNVEPSPATLERLQGELQNMVASAAPKPADDVLQAVPERAKPPVPSAEHGSVLVPSDASGSGTGKVGWVIGAVIAVAFAVVGFFAYTKAPLESPPQAQASGASPVVSVTTTTAPARLELAPPEAKPEPSKNPEPPKKPEVPTVSETVAKKPASDKLVPDKKMAPTDTAARAPSGAGGGNAQRCSALLSKSSLGEPLSPSEKQEIQQSCH